ncbi:MAG: hypothetical protein CSB06_00195 [Bacteroidia bacterium]|nr:MAG: hypothetical protein CSB06_00195 [Bacteroidia bacterium]
MKKAVTLSAIIICAMSLQLQAQKIKVKEGNLDFLKNEKFIDIAYKYDDMKVGKMTEEKYVEKTKKKYNDKEEGKGDRWAEAWEADRANRFEPKFESLLNKYLDSKGILAEDGSQDAKYTMTVHTTWTEPGFFGGVVQKPAYISGLVIFTEKGNESKKLAVLEFIKSPGNSVASFDTGERIKEAYAKLGKTLAKYLLKKGF